MRRNLFERSTFIKLKLGKGEKEKKEPTAHPKSNEIMKQDTDAKKADEK